MHRVWLVIPVRGVAIDIEGVLGAPPDARCRQRLVERARERYRDRMVRLIPGTASFAYVRLEGAGADRLAELRDVGLPELREVVVQASRQGEARTLARRVRPTLGPPVA